MQHIRVDQIHRNRVSDRAAVQEREQRLHLYAQNQFESQRPTFAGIGKLDLSALHSTSDQSADSAADKSQEAQETLSLRMRDGTYLEIPLMPKSDRHEVEGWLQSADHGTQVLATAKKLAAATYNEMRQGRDEHNHSLEYEHAAQTSYQQDVTVLPPEGSANREGQLVLMGLYGSEQNLKDFFNKVRSEQGVATELKEDIAELEEMLIDWPENGGSEQFDYRDVRFNDDGSITVVGHEGSFLTRAEAEALLNKLKAKVETLGQFENRDMMQLQWMVNRYQQSMTILTNILKNKHDTHKAIIANVRA
jgi:hypothetical protein